MYLGNKQLHVASCNGITQAMIKIKFAYKISMIVILDKNITNLNTFPVERKGHVSVMNRHTHSNHKQLNARGKERLHMLNAK